MQESAPVNPSRLQEIIARLGEICLTPELIHVVLFPEEAHTGSNINSLACHDPALAIGFMEALSAYAQDCESRLLNAGRFLTAFQSRCLPPPTLVTLRNPLHLCAWRLETPPRVCLYTGEHPLDPRTLDLSAHLPHTLSKILLEDRSKRPTPSRIHLLHQSEDIDNDHTPDAIRTSLLHYAQTSLTSYRERLPLAKTTAQDHTLEEAFASLIHPPTRNHTLIALNQSPPWDKDHVDSRYTHENNNSYYYKLHQAIITIAVMMSAHCLAPSAVMGSSHHTISGPAALPYSRNTGSCREAEVGRSAFTTFSTITLRLPVFTRTNLPVLSSLTVNSLGPVLLVVTVVGLTAPRITFLASRARITAVVSAMLPLTHALSLKYPLANTHPLVFVFGGDNPHVFS